MSLSDAKKKLLAQRLAGKGMTRPPIAATIPVRPIGTKDLLAPGQRHLLFQFLTDPDSPSYNITSSFSVRGGLDVDLLNRAAESVVARHQILRSSFVQDGASEVQIVERDFHLRVGHVRTSPGENIRVLARAEAAKPFDIFAEPPIRLHFLQSDTSDEGLLMLVVHHCLFDEWSAEIFWREFAEEHRRLTGGGVSDQVPRLPIQYADFAHWQRTRETAGDYRSQLDYWRKQLSQLPMPLRIPLDHPRMVEYNDASSVERLNFDRQLTSTIKQLALQTDTSPFIVLLTGFKILLHRYTGAKDIIVGTPIANRKSPEIENLIGFFLSTVAIRADFSDDPTVTDVLAQVRSNVLGAFDHLDVPFDQIVEMLKPQRIPGEHPVFQVMFVYEREHPTSAEMDLNGTKLTTTLIDTGAAKFDITLFVIERAGELEALIEYRSQAFKRETMQRMLGHLRQVLSTITSNQASRVSEVTLLTRQERTTLLQAWRSPAAQLPVVHTIASWATATPDALALIDGDKRQPYGEVFALACQLAGVLTAKGFGAGDYIGLFVSRRADAIIGILGIHLAGAAYVPIDPSYPADRRHYMIQDCCAQLIATTTALRPSLEGSSAEIICIDALAESVFEMSPSIPSLVAPAYAIYTSGSTGHPKGVVISQANLAWSTAARRSFYSESPTRFLLIPSLSFDSSVAGIFWTLATGGTLVLMPDKLEQDIDALAELISREKITHVLCLPSLYELLLRYGDAAKLTTVTTVIVAGEACPIRLAQRHAATLPSAALFNEYGPTEATVWCAAHKVDPDTDTDVVPIGRPIGGASIYLLDAYGQLVPQGIPGEIYVGGAGVATGYLGSAELAALRFLPDRFAQDNPGARLYRTGDLGRYQGDGTIVFLGRADDQVKVRGHRIELGEIETTLRQHVTVGEVAVLAHSDVALDALYEIMRQFDYQVADRLLAELEKH